MQLIDHLKRRYNKARTIADQWESILEASFHFAVPFRNRFYEPKQFQGAMKNARLYDTTAVEATKRFVSKLQNAMTPPQVQWGYLEVEALGDDIESTDLEDMQRALDIYMRRLFMYIHASNFDVSINECYFDLAVGTSALVVNSYTDDQPLLFTSIPIDKLVIEEAFNGRIETWFRTWDDIKINEIHLRWAKAIIPPELQQETIDCPDATVSLIYEGVLFFPNDKKQYKYCVWTENSLLLVEELESNPGIVWRFQKTNNEVWGRGPVMDALPSIISLNEMARVELASANLNTFRPYMGFSDGVFNPHTFKLEPFTVIPISPVGSEGQLPLVPLPDSSNPSFGEMKINDLRAQILKLLFAETPQDSESIQPQTATSLVMKQQTLADQIGPLFSRLQQEFLAPLIARCSYILDKRGILKKPVFKGQRIAFKYKSPLEVSQGQQDVSVFTQYVQLLQGIVGPEMANVFINPSEAPYLIAEKLQIDPRFLNSPDNVARVMQQQQNQIAEAQEQAQMTGQPVQQPGV